MAKKLRVAVLMGGNSAERQVSLATGRQVLNTLDPEKYEVYALDTASGQKFLPDASEMANPVKMLMTAEGAIEVTTLNDLPQVSPMDRPDVVFIALHGPGGEDGTVQGFLETIGVPYTGSGVLASALAMDKARCKMFLGVESIVTPPGMIYEKRNLTPRRRTSEDVARNLGFPVVVKPSRQGSTYGCTIARDESELAKAMETAFRYDSVLLIEERLVGTEITVAVLGNNDPVVLPIVEIVAKDGFFDYESKYSAGESGAVEIVPARIDDEIKREAQENRVALSSFARAAGA